MKHMYAGVFFLFALIACIHTPAVAPESSSDTSVATQSYQKPLDLSATGKIEFIYYPDPGDNKTYHQLSITDTALINTLSSNILHDTITQSECSHDVKMFFIRNGEVYKTIYGATADSCRYFAYAINSNPFYARMEERSFVIIDSLKKKAR